jgi:hypothetical protein
MASSTEVSDAWQESDCRTGHSDCGPARLQARWREGKGRSEARENSSAHLVFGTAQVRDRQAGVYAPDGTAYIVGATRAGPPSTAVLRIDVDAALRALSTTVARAGAAATWVYERGLLVVGGAEEECGAELPAEGSDTFVPVPFRRTPPAAPRLHQSMSQPSCDSAARSPMVRQPIR